MTDTRIIVFDMDGVITSEEGYWRAAACTVLDLAARFSEADSQRLVQSPLPPPVTIDRQAISAIKGLAINTNWDLCHLAAVMLCEGLAKAGHASQINGCDWSADHAIPLASWPGNLSADFAALLRDFLSLGLPGRGFELMEALARHTAGVGLNPELFVRQGPLWNWCFRHFQVWFTGTVAAASEGFAVSYAPPRAGILSDEELILPAPAIRETLRALAAEGWTLAVATGRTRTELIPTLGRFGLLEYFDPERIITHEEIAAAEAVLAAEGRPAPLSKPSPFPFLRALYPGSAPAALAFGHVGSVPPETIFVGDTVGDMAPARLLGARGVAVLTGPGGAAAELALRAAGATDVIADVTALPALLRGELT